VKKIRQILRQDQSAFISTWVAPVHDKQDCEFGLADFVMFFALVAGTIEAVRFLIGL
jgi:hypothetical protein